MVLGEKKIVSNFVNFKLVVVWETGHGKICWLTALLKLILFLGPQESGSESILDTLKLLKF